MPATREMSAALLRQPAYVLLWLLALLLNMFSGHAADLGLPLSPDRLCLGAAIMLLLLDRDAWAAQRLVLQPVHVAMLGLVLLAAWSASVHGVLASSFSTYALLDRLVFPFLLFSLTPIVFATNERRAWLLRTLVLMGLYLGVLALLERVGPHQLIFPRYIDDPDVGIQFGRARGPFTESVANGVVLAICGFASALAAVRSTGVWRVLAAITAPLCALGVLLTLTRSVWVGTTAGLVLVLLRERRLRRFAPVVLVAAAAAVLLALAVVPGLRDSVDQRSQDQRSVDDRRNTNAAAIRIIEQDPLTGIGWTRFLAEGTDYVRQSSDYPVTNVTIEVHNVVLSRTAELGIPGGALWVLAALGSVGLALVKRVPEHLRGWQLVALGSVAVWLTASLLSPLANPLPNQLVWTLAGVVLTPYLVTPRRPVAPALTPAAGSQGLP